MPLDASIAGREYPPSDPYLIGREKVAEFAVAVGEGGSAYVGADGNHAATPPTFAFVVATRGLQQLLDDPELDVELSRVIHGDQQFRWTRPLRVGDEVVARTRIAGVRAGAGMDVVTLETDLVTTTGETVVTSTATLFCARAPQASAAAGAA